MHDLSPPVQQPTQVRYKVLAWMCALGMITYIDRVCIKNVQGDMQRDLNISDQAWAWVFSSFALAYALFEVPSGWLGDRYGARRVLCRIVLWWSLFTALTGCVWYFTLDSGYALDLPFGIEIPLLFNSLVLLVIIRFLFGMGEAGAYPNIARALRNWFPYARRGLAQGYVWMFSRWGGALSPLILVIAWLVTWRGAFFVFGLMGVVWVVGFWLWYRDTPRQHPSVNEGELAIIEGVVGDTSKPAPLSWKTMMRSRTLWLLSLMYFCSNCGWCFFITWDVKYYEKVLGIERDSLALALASGMPLFFGGIACILGGLLTDRQVRLWGRRWGRTLQGVVAYSLSGTFFFVALMTNDPFFSVMWLCLASFIKDFAMAASWSTCIDIGHRYAGTVAGFMNMVGNLGTFFTPPLVAYLANVDLGKAGAEQSAAWGVALAFSGTMFLIASACWLFIEPRRVIVYTEEDRRRLQLEGTLA